MSFSFSFDIIFPHKGDKHSSNTDFNQLNSNSTHQKSENPRGHLQFLPSARRHLPLSQVHR